MSKNSSFWEDKIQENKDRDRFKSFLGRLEADFTRHEKRASEETATIFSKQLTDLIDSKIEQNKYSIQLKWYWERVPYDYVEILEDIAIEKGLCIDVENFGGNNGDSCDLLISWE